MLTTYVKDLTLRLGPITTKGKLVAIQKSDSKKSAPKFNFVTPDGGSVRKVYQDIEGNVYEETDLSKREVISYAAKESGEVGVVVTQEQLKEAKAKEALPVNIVNLTVHNTHEVTNVLYPAKTNAYVFVPDPKDPANDQWYAMLLELLKDESKSYMAIANIKNFEGLYRVFLWNGKVALQKQLYPEDLNVIPDIPVKFPVNENSVAKAKVMVDKLTTEFNAADYTNTAGQTLRDFVESAKNGTGQPVSPVVKSAGGTIDLESILDSFGEL